MGRSLLVFIAVLALFHTAFGQTPTPSPVTTDPVGFITLTANGAASTYLGLSMTQVVAYQGLVATGTIPANTVPAANNPGWTDNQFNPPPGDTLNAADNAYFVEITSGPNAGRISDIVGTSAASQSLQTADNLGLSGGETFKIRRQWTLARVFGPNASTSNAVLLAGGTTASSADQVVVYNRTSGAYLTYYYKLPSRSNNSQGWRLTSSTNPLTDDYSNQKLEIYDGIIVVRQGSTSVAISLAGAVKLGQTQLLIMPGNNLVSDVYPVGLTLGTSNLYNASTPNNSLLGGTTASSADQVVIYNGTSYLTYYYKLASRSNNTTGWRSTAGSDPLNTDVSSTPLPAGSSFFVVRQSGQSSFFWISQQPF